MVGYSRLREPLSPIALVPQTSLARRPERSEGFQRIPLVVAFSAIPLEDLWG
jgi:hypothetical protein